MVENKIQTSAPFPIYTFPVKIHFISLQLPICRWNGGSEESKMGRIFLILPRSVSKAHKEDLRGFKWLHCGISQQFHSHLMSSRSNNSSVLHQKCPSSCTTRNTIQMVFFAIFITKQFGDICSPFRPTETEGHAHPPPMNHWQRRTSSSSSTTCLP